MTSPSEITLHWRESLYACDVGVRRRLSGIHHNRTQPHGNPADDADTWEMDIESASAEYATSVVLDLPWNDQVVRTPGGPDVGLDIEVRWTKHKRGHLFVFDDDPIEWRYVLVTGRTPTFKVFPPITGTRAKNMNWYRPTKNGTMAFWVPQEALWESMALT